MSFDPTAKPSPINPRNLIAPTGGTECPVSREEFSRNAQPIALDIGGQRVTADAMTFSSGGVGWNYSGKLTLRLANGQTVKVQCGVNLSVIGSKALPVDALTAAQLAIKAAKRSGDDDVLAAAFAQLAAAKAAMVAGQPAAPAAIS